MRRYHRFPAAALLAILVSGTPWYPCVVRACGPWLPEQILTSRQVILRTPVGDFAQEVIALTEEDGAPTLPPGCTRLPWSPIPPDEDFNEETSLPKPDPFDREAGELIDALTQRGVPPERRDALAAAYRSFRRELTQATPETETFGANQEDASVPFEERARKLREKPGSTIPKSSALPPGLAASLPGEWADYLEGAWRFRRGDLAGADAAWERVLARPFQERLDCSIRAAYMLARIHDDLTVPAADNARRYRRVRELRAEGCHDLYNLTSDSFGWEARRSLYDDDLPAAARLYYLQAVTGGNRNPPDMIRSSLREVAAEALGGEKADPAAMAAAARDPFLRRVATLYVACSRHFGEEPRQFVPPAPPSDDSDAAARVALGQAWLAALNAAGINEVRESVGIAWAAYQEGDFKLAAAWLGKAPATDRLAFWLRAKLALRDGKTEVAARDFAQAVRLDATVAKRISDGLDGATCLVDDGAEFRARQFQADLGIIRLARSDYTQALAALVKSGFWNDAAYVAERVLTVAELRAFVRANFPQAPSPVEPPPPLPVYGDEAEERWTWYQPPLDPLRTMQEALAPLHSSNPAAYCTRYLLARRLARDGRYAEAREYYPPLLWPKFDEYVAARRLGGDGRQPRAKRADALWRAAKITRWLGMELFGTEGEPDWFVYNGDFEGDSYRAGRQGHPASRGSWEDPSPTPLLVQIPPVGPGEKRRIAPDQVRPESRYHYRYLAADLAWQAAALMPDEQDDTARVLSAGGHWLLSVQADQAADRFYQAIVRRCGRTALGSQAEKSKTLPDVAHEDP